MTSVHFHPVTELNAIKYRQTAKQAHKVKHAGRRASRKKGPWLAVTKIVTALPLVTTPDIFYVYLRGPR